jgi:hypothetical protein
LLEHEALEVDEVDDEFLYLDIIDEVDEVDEVEVEADEELYFE